MGIHSEPEQGAKVRETKADDGERTTTRDRQDRPAPDSIDKLLAIPEADGRAEAKRDTEEPFIERIDDRNPMPIEVGDVRWQRFFVRNHRSDHVRWVHEPLGDKLRVEEKNEKLALKPLAPGTHSVVTHAAVPAGSKKVANVTLKSHVESPKIKMRIANAFSRSERGDVPVDKSMQVGETLHLTIQATNIAKKRFEHFSLETTTLPDFEDATIESRENARFKVRMKPTKVGYADGLLHVLPERTDEHGSEPVKLSLRIDDMSGRHDHGGVHAGKRVDQGRPSSAENNASRFRSAVERWTNVRESAVNQLMGQEKINDPIPSHDDGVFSKLLGAAARIALASATAGMSEAASAIFRLTDGKKEFVKVFMENGLNQVIDGLAATKPGASDDVDSKLTKPSGSDLYLRPFFQLLQNRAIWKMHDQDAEAFISTVMSQVREMNKADPMSGERYLLQATEEAIAQRDRIHAKQIESSFFAWCNLMSTLASGSKDGVTEANKYLDPKRLLVNPSGGVLTEEKWSSKGVEKISGILQIEVSKHDAPVAKIPGITNKGMLAPLTKRPVKDLPIAMIVSSTRGPRGRDSWLFSRDESKKLHANGDLEGLAAHAGTQSWEEAAQKVLKDIGTLSLSHMELVQ